MKKTILFGLLILLNVSNAQNRMSTSNAQINFEASVPYLEPITARNNKVVVKFDIKNQFLECFALIADYNFETRLMREHFNQNYMESGRYPKAVFKGKIRNFDLNAITEIPQEHIIDGKMSLHGKSKKNSVVAFIQKTSNGSIKITSNFVLNPNDFSIEIPETISNKIAKSVTTNLVADLQY